MQLFKKKQSSGADNGEKETERVEMLKAKLAELDSSGDEGSMSLESDYLFRQIWFAKRSDGSWSCGVPAYILGEEEKKELSELKEFVYDNGLYQATLQRGDAEGAAMLAEKVFREVFGLPSNYNITVKMMHGSGEAPTSGETKGEGSATSQGAVQHIMRMLENARSDKEHPPTSSPQEEVMLDVTSEKLEQLKSTVGELEEERVQLQREIGKIRLSIEYKELEAKMLELEAEVRQLREGKQTLLERLKPASKALQKSIKMEASSK